jgi:Na+/H+ antiporter NhaD/arsenite permease-like protein
MIASGPLLYAAFWHKHYTTIAVLLATLVIGYYTVVLHEYSMPLHTLVEYIQFITLISALYIAAGGIHIHLKGKANTKSNILFLITGAVLSNIIGTTGASMLLIRPYIRFNKSRIRPYHIIFFIFLISNVGGALTPIGDPPLFLGFLKGVPFHWTLHHNVGPWVIALVALCSIFYYLDSRHKHSHAQDSIASSHALIAVTGKRNFLWLMGIVVAVFIDPNLFPSVPAIHYHGNAISFVRELIFLAISYVAYRYADKHALRDNAFSWEPLKEVIILFFGIFSTMMPALFIISNYAQTLPSALITPTTLYWGTGLLSSMLDNAPTYLNFLAASMASQGADMLQHADVYQYAIGGYMDSILRLKAISIAAVFFGAMTYIGNGPNFMVKSIAEQLGIRMPSFGKYILSYAIPFLLPVLAAIWLLCCYWHHLL